MRKLVLVVVAAILAALFIQPITSYRNAQAQLAQARADLAGARADRARATAERRALGTRAVLVREARRRGYIFPGETPYSVSDR